MRESRRRATPIAAILVVSLALGLGIVAYRTRAGAVTADPTNRPTAVKTDGYVSSDACAACHPSQYATWHDSFHRTMTQLATPETVRADFDGVQVDHVHGRPMHLERRGDELWAEFDDPGWRGPSRSGTRPRITRQVVMITGSHHQQIYWYATGHDRALNVLPGVYLIDEARWADRSAVTLHPPSQQVAMLDGHWNAICIACHTTFPRTRFDTPFQSAPIDEQAVETTVAELGIACEACHGPGADHVDTNRNPVRRYRHHLDERADPTIVLPTRLDPDRGSQVCGQCHGVWEFPDAAAERAANRDGFAYRPGDDLRRTRFIPQPAADPNAPALRRFIERDPEFVVGSFWSDGMIRVSGREYNGLIDSPCFTQATDANRTLSCFSCHAMHKAPDDARSIATWADTHQLSPESLGDAACTACHEPLAADLTAHTTHAADSTGSVCYNCHMPYTSYGLLKALRSHTISSPTVSESVEHGRPNACNLCHLDKTLAWTQTALQERFGVTPQGGLTDEAREVAAGLRWLVGGDAGQRAIAAWSFGWAPAQEASGTSWMVPHLAELLNDPYEAVRFIAYRSLRSLPGYARLKYDYLANRDERMATAVPLIRDWTASARARERRDPALLVDADGTLRVEALRRLFDGRNTRPLFLRE